MSSTLFENIGLGNLDVGYLFIGIIILLIINIVLLSIFISKQNKLSKKYAKFMRGKDAKSLEKEIINIFEDNRFFKIELEKDKKDITELYRRMVGAVQKVGLIKYDAYQQMGGLLSFSLAMLDENNTGFILNSVHSSEGCYIYAKEVVNGECKLELGNEEKMALDQAMGE